MGRPDTLVGHGQGTLWPYPPIEVQKQSHRGIQRNTEDTEHEPEGAAWAGMRLSTIDRVKRWVLTILTVLLVSLGLAGVYLHVRAKSTRDVVAFTAAGTLVWMVNQPTDPHDGGGMQVRLVFAWPKEECFQWYSGSPVSEHFHTMPTWHYGGLGGDTATWRRIRWHDFVIWRGRASFRVGRDGFPALMQNFDYRQFDETAPQPSLWIWEARVPHWMFIAAAVLLPSGRTGITLYSIYRRHRRRRKHLCPACGYDLRASPERCPECGAAAAKPSESTLAP